MAFKMKGFPAQYGVKSRVGKIATTSNGNLPDGRSKSSAFQAKKSSAFPYVKSSPARVEGYQRIQQEALANVENLNLTPEQKVEYMKDVSLQRKDWYNSLIKENKELLKGKNPKERSKFIAEWMGDFTVPEYQASTETTEEQAVEKDPVVSEEQVQQIKRPSQQEMISYYYKGTDLGTGVDKLTPERKQELDLYFGSGDTESLNWKKDLPKELQERYANIEFAGESDVEGSVHDFNPDVQQEGQYITLDDIKKSRQEAAIASSFQKRKKK